MDENRELYLVGISYRTALASVQQVLSFSPTQAAGLLRKTASQVPELEAVLLSTCNRTEFYVAAAPGSPAVETLFHTIRRERPSPIRQRDCERYEQFGNEAMRHLLRVACGLESSVLGDVQILSQIKQAVDVASISGTMGKMLSRAFGQAIRCGRTARSKTRISRGCAGIGSAIVETISRRLKETNSTELPRVLLIGAGQTAAEIAWHLSKRHLGCWTIVNRTREHAYRLAARCGGEAARWEDLDRLVSSSGVVVAATSAEQPLVRREHLEKIAESHPREFPLLIDAGKPPNIESGGRYPVVDIDSIRVQSDAVLAARESAIPEVEELLREEMNEWRRWLAARPIESALADLYQKIELQSREAAEKLLVKGTEVSLEQAQRVFRASFRHLLTEHARRLRRLSGESCGETVPRKIRSNPASASVARPVATGANQLEHNIGH